MTAADFTRDVRAELQLLRRAHVVTNVEIGTDMLVGVSFSLDGRAMEFTVHVTNAEQRQWAFEHALRALRHLRGRHTPRVLAPTERRSRIRIPVERHVQRERWSMLAILAGSVAICAAALVVIGWVLS